MEAPSPAPLTPAQFAAMTAGDGHACLVDPTTQTVYHVVQQSPPPTIDDDYIRAKLAEAQEDVDRGNVSEWNLADVKRELHERLARKSWPQ